MLIFTCVLLNNAMHRYSEGGDHMTMVRIHSIQELINLPKTKWNIPQPLESEEREDCLKTGGLDLILVPGLCFTKEGWRLGRGKVSKANRNAKSSFIKCYHLSCRGTMTIL